MISNSERRTTFYQLRLHTSTGSLGQNWTIRLQETRNKAFYKFLVPIACFGPKHLTGPTELDWNHCSLPLLRLVNFGYVTATTIAEPLRLTANWTKIRAIAVNIFLFFLKNNPSFNISESGQIHPLDISITSITLSIKPSIIVNLLHFYLIWSTRKTSQGKYCLLSTLKLLKTLMERENVTLFSSLFSLFFNLSTPAPAMDSFKNDASLKDSRFETVISGLRFSSALLGC